MQTVARFHRACKLLLASIGHLLAYIGQLMEAVDDLLMQGDGNVAWL